MWLQLYCTLGLPYQQPESLLCVNMKRGVLSTVEFVATIDTLQRIGNRICNCCKSWCRLRLFAAVILVCTFQSQPTRRTVILPKEKWLRTANSAKPDAHRTVPGARIALDPDGQKHWHAFFREEWPVNLFDLDDRLSFVLPTWSPTVMHGV